MHRSPDIGITTVKERCRVCYTCVRECPAKAIRINDGQAEVLAARCIGCGNCVRVCSQKAKQVVSSVDRVRAFLADPSLPVVALLAPSFPAEFVDCEERRLAGMLRAIGFAAVHEVAFGADLVARRYRRQMTGGAPRPRIATTCPAVVLYVQKYFPHLVESLSPIVSPMVATARAIRRLRAGAPCRCVFLGPCIAKKVECQDGPLAGEIDAALTFVELRQMLAEAGAPVAHAAPVSLDPPHGGIGALLALSHGLPQAAAISEELLAKQVMATEGCENFADAIKSFDAGVIDTRLLELLACKGCIMGAGMTSGQSLFLRQAAVSAYTQRKLAQLDAAAWRETVARFDDLDLTRPFAADDQRAPPPTADELRAILVRMGKKEPGDELNCGACGYGTCREHAIAIHTGLAESEMCLPYTIDLLNKTVAELASSNQELATTQEALMHSEKLASMGQLAAGIAHEVNNPIGVVLMYGHLLLERLPGEGQLRQDAAMIVEQAERCKRIVAGLLHFARQNKVLRQPVRLSDLVARSLRGAVKPDKVNVVLAHGQDAGRAELDVDQMAQVLANLLANAYDAMPAGGTLTIRTHADERTATFEIADTGCGIPPENLHRIFDPFFTTKRIGVGTGLGLAVSYGIVKMHHGSIRVESHTQPQQGPTGTRFTIEIPCKDKE
jgi:signal transduction histidine kinase/iron only hydrogenase large subunit-like protein